MKWEVSSNVVGSNSFSVILLPLVKLEDVREVTK